MTPDFPDTPQAIRLRRKLVNKLKRERTIRTASVESAFLNVPRHLFVPEASVEAAYNDQVIGLKYEEDKAISSSSQPGMMAIMLEQLALEPGMRVLEIGAGSGFNAGLMGHIVAPTGQVISIDIDEDLVEQARINLQVAGCDNVEVICADGSYGYADDAPYDRIVLTVAAWDIALAWREQLAADGRMVLPLTLTDRYQVSTVLVAQDTGFVSLENTACRFMSLRGDFAVPDTWDYIELAKDFTVFVDNRTGVDRSLLIDLLRQAHPVVPTETKLTDSELHDARLWWSLNMPETIVAQIASSLLKKAILPCLSARGDFCMTNGLVNGDGLALWGKQSTRWKLTNYSTSFEMMIHPFGADGEDLSMQMLDMIQTWDMAGRPTINQLRLAVIPIDQSISQSPGQIILERDTVRIVVWFEPIIV